ncbi:MAG TPA: hypothetical protein VIH52_02945 [Candidatus Nanoarchaeia archaeon]|nr:hypothetical protein [uncultured archaeon]
MQEITDAVTNAVSEALSAAADFLPNLLWAIVIFVVGVIIAAILRNLLVRVLELVSFERSLATTGIPAALKKADPALTVTKLLAELLRWFVILVFLGPAVSQLGLEEVNDVIRDLINYIPNIVVAVIIVTVGSVFANIARDFVTATSSTLGTQTARAAGQIARWAITVFAVLAALSQLGVAQDLINILITGFVAMLAIAGGLAFGLGGKETAESMLKKMREEMEER